MTKCLHVRTLYLLLFICIQVVADEAATVVSMFNFDVLGSHTSWQCVELLLTHLPLLRLLLSVLLGSYKRVGYSFYFVGICTCNCLALYFDIRLTSS